MSISISPEAEAKARQIPDISSSLGTVHSGPIRA